MKLFCVLDVKAGFFMQPFPEQSTISALRGFDAAVNGKDSIFSRFPDDFCLMEIAEFDQSTGVVKPLPAPQNLGSARTVLKVNPEVQSPLFDPRVGKPTLRINEDKAHQ